MSLLCVCLDNFSGCESFCNIFNFGHFGYFGQIGQILTHLQACFSSVCKTTFHLVVLTVMEAFVNNALQTVGLIQGDILW